MTQIGPGHGERLCNVWTGPGPRSPASDLDPDVRRVRDHLDNARRWPGIWFLVPSIAAEHRCTLETLLRDQAGPDVRWEWTAHYSAGPDVLNLRLMAEAPKEN